ncbi:MAG: helix-turn-helix transcriptional regulator [bacterium]|nr:helix-turn-helix transcriptional regulator [bacterium]
MLTIQGAYATAVCYAQTVEQEAIYKWQRGDALPTVDNLVALSAVLGVPVEGILVVEK